MDDLYYRELVNSDPIFFGQYRPLILSDIIGEIPNDRCWNDEDTCNLASVIEERYNLDSDTAYSEIISILEFLEVNKLIDLNNYKKQTKKGKRKLLLPNSPSHFHSFDNIGKMSTLLWGSWISPKLDRDDLLFPFIFTMMVDGGYGYPLMPNSIFDLRLCDVTTNRTLLLSASTNKVSIFCTEIKIPNTSSIILSKMLRGRYNDPEESYLFFPLLDNQKSRHGKLKSILNNQYKDFVTNFKHDLNSPPSLNTFYQIAPLLAVRNGLSPHIASIQSKVNLPVTGIWSDYHSIFRRKEITQHDGEHKRLLKKLTLPPSINTISVQALTDTDYNVTADKDWSGRAASIYMDFLGKLDKLKIEDLGHADVRDRLSSIVVDFRKRADSLSNPGSALHLAIEWSYYLIVIGNVKKTSSLRTYFSRVFASGIFASPKAAIFHQLENEEHQELLNQRLQEKELKLGTIHSILDSWYRVYLFAYSSGYIVEAKLESVITSCSESRKSSLVLPTEFDNKIALWRRNDNYELSILAHVAEILYYTGLRDGEITVLRLRDIIIKGKTCYIVIRGGKSGNAKRIIPYHLHATKDALIRLHKLWEQRKLLPHSDLDSALFGDFDDPGFYRQKSLLAYLRIGLKQLFGPNVVPHTLRHCFYNNLSIRVEAINCPDLLDKMPDKKHELFSKDNQKELQYYLYGTNEINIASVNNVSSWREAKLMGHATPEEGIYTYGHSLPYLQEAYIGTLNSRTANNIMLTRGAAELLLANMLSRKTRARKLPKELSISDALEMAWSEI